MSVISYKAEMSNLQREAAIADKRLADFVVTMWCWIAILGIALLCVEVLL